MVSLARFFLIQLYFSALLCTSIYSISNIFLEVCKKMKIFKKIKNFLDIVFIVEK